MVPLHSHLAQIDCRRIPAQLDFQAGPYPPAILIMGLERGCVLRTSRSNTGTSKTCESPKAAAGAPHTAALRKMRIAAYPRRRWLICFMFLATAMFTVFAGRASEAVPATVLSRFLAGQTNVQTWSADFVQVRTLKALTQPLRTPGHLWFAAPNRFRWELGRPAQTIAVRREHEMLVLYPRLKRAERYSLAKESPAAWRDALALLDAGFPRSAAEIESRFRILDERLTDNLATVVLEPKSPAARRFMSKLRLIIDPASLELKATELEFADGSTLRNEYAQGVANGPLDEKLFQPEISPAFKIVEPLKGKE